MKPFAVSHSRLLIVVFCLLTLSVFSQQYNTSIGVRGDWSNLNIDLAELSAKHFFDRNNDLEANFGFGKEYFWLEGMYHRNQTLKKEVDWYVGGGADIGYWNTSYNERYHPGASSGFWIGSSYVLGVEYTAGFIPINLALDVGPTIRIVPQRAIGIKVGFSLRYAFR